MTQIERIKHARALLREAREVLQGVSYDAHGSDHVQSMVDAAQGGLTAASTLLSRARLWVEQRRGDLL